MSKLSGIYAATVTAFDDKQRFDAGAFRTHLDTLIDSGIDGIVFCGGTGEFAYLSDAERKEIIEVGCKHVQGRAGIIVNTSAIRDTTAVYWAQHAEDCGADALMILPPYFEGPDESGVRAFFATLDHHVSRDILLYNIPVHSGFDIDADLYETLKNSLQHVVGIKDSTGDMVRLLDLIARGGKVFNGCDPLAFSAMAAGVSGCIWGGANAMPTAAADLWRLTQQQQWQAANDLWQTMLPANLFFWQNAYNPAVKTATNLLVNKVGACRTPAQPLTEGELTALQTVLSPLK